MLGENLSGRKRVPSVAVVPVWPSVGIDRLAVVEENVFEARTLIGRTARLPVTEIRTQGRVPGYYRPRVGPRRWVQRRRVIPLIVLVHPQGQGHLADIARAFRHPAAFHRIRDPGQ